MVLPGLFIDVQPDDALPEAELKQFVAQVGDSQIGGFRSTNRHIADFQFGAGGLVRVKTIARSHGIIDRRLTPVGGAAGHQRNVPLYHAEPSGAPRGIAGIGKRRRAQKRAE